MIIPLPPILKDLFYGHELNSGLGKSTIIADIDFETYSEAGFYWNDKTGKWNGKGLTDVGVVAYTEHPSCEVLSCAYDLKDGHGVRTWSPQINDPPWKLFNYLEVGRFLECWNLSFEWYVWENVCVKKYGWPSLKQYVNQLRCAMAKSRAFSLPGALENAGDVLKTNVKKDKAGKQLLDMFSRPRSPTKIDNRTRYDRTTHPEEFKKLINYNIQDIKAEAEISSKCPDLIEFELKFWQTDQAINRRGVKIDVPLAESFLKIINQAEEKYNPELAQLTNNRITSASQAVELRRWINEQGIPISGLSSQELITTLDESDLPVNVRRALEIREMLSQASIRKIPTMLAQRGNDNRLRELYRYHSARTGRAAGADSQPQNFPREGIPLIICKCGKYRSSLLEICRFCGNSEYSKAKWNFKAVEQFISIIQIEDINLIEYYLGNALGILKGCLRGLFIADEGKDLICSDYSAIEAVVLAALAKEEWRLEVFRTHGKIYESSASKISGIPLNEIIEYPEIHGVDHPLRMLGKIAELASGYGGGMGAWLNFKADKYMSTGEIEKSIKAWRAASPKIVNLWYQSDRDAKSAILNPGYWFGKYFMQSGILYCKLLSERYLTYHNARIEPGKYGDQITYEGWNTTPKNGPIHKWIRMSIYGGKFIENEVQATARDIFAHGIMNLEEAGYSVVLHSHDEPVAEIPKSFGSIEEFERLMTTLPAWALDWPIQAKGGWRGHRYRK